jgi:renalase
MIIPAGLNAFAKHLAAGLEVRLQTCVTRISADGDHFTLETDKGECLVCQDLVLAMALEETLGLLATLAPGPELAGIRALLGMFASVPSLTIMAAYPMDVPGPDWDILYPDAPGNLQLISRDSGKRDQPKYLTLVVQASPRWSRERMDAPVEAWSAELLGAAAALVGGWMLQPLWTSSQRWRYARVDRGNELARPLLTQFKAGPRLGLAGDVFTPGGGVQAAWLSGSALAQRLLNEEQR